jgi:uncharacterized protein (DUF1684 family)
VKVNAIDLAARRAWIYAGLVLAAIVVLGILAVGGSSGPGAPDSSQRIKKLMDTRAEIDSLMRQGSKSPIPPDKKNVLLPLQYFAPDFSYSAPAALELSPPGSRPVAPMPTSTGGVDQYERVGFLRFTLQGQEYSLGAFVPSNTQAISELFVPFKDETNGNETYSAGRYLNLEPTNSGLYEIDFNYAYNPYCAYNTEYECPYPPPSNQLKVAIRAGEKAPVH